MAGLADKAAVADTVIAAANAFGGQTVSEARTLAIKGIRLKAKRRTE